MIENKGRKEKVDIAFSWRPLLVPLPLTGE
jgi:hypothetical protein